MVLLCDAHQIHAKLAAKPEVEVAAAAVVEEEAAAGAVEAHAVAVVVENAVVSTRT